MANYCNIMVKMRLVQVLVILAYSLFLLCKLRRSKSENNEVILSKPTCLPGPRRYVDDFLGRLVHKKVAPPRERSSYPYPLYVDMPHIVQRLRNHQSVEFTPINKPKITALLHPTGIRCPPINQLNVYLIVKSSNANLHLRNRIRTTWGSSHHWLYSNPVLVFLISNTLNTTQQKLITREAKDYQDMWLLDTIEHYHNNTMKMMFAFEEVPKMCSSVKFAFFVDDDYIVNTLQTVKFLLLLLGENQEYHQTKFVIGDLNEYSRPYRTFLTPREKRWYISEAEYALTTFPPYVGGGAFLTSVSTLIDLKFASWYTKYLRFDDVYIGFLLHKLGIRPQHAPSIESNGCESPKSLNNLIASHCHRETNEFDLSWTDISNYLNQRCT